MLLWWNVFILIFVFGLNGGVFASQPDRDCPDNDFMCANGRCILLEWKCDSRDDCGDNSDEIGCPPSTTCAKGQISCSGGECIPILWRCDGENDCTDGGDEKDCHTNTCDEESELRCDHGQCIPKTWTCDGTTDCYDGTDERNCSAKPVSCNFEEFRCEDGACIDKKLVCDQRKDCPDGSDERNCTTQTADQCNQNQFFCANISKCISQKWLCDGDNDCGDESDEEPNFCRKSPTSTLPPFKNMLECEEFFCEYSGECIPWTKVCDGKSDCDDLMDEGLSCYTACRDNGGCSQKCTKTPTGSKCSCVTGYKLMDDDTTCEDIDECSIPGYCSQFCNNTKGGFKCRCVEGYVLEHNQHRKCKADGAPATLVYLLPDEIRALDINSNNLKVLYSDKTADMNGIDYDAAESKFFWTDWEHGTLNSYTQNTNEKIALLTAPIRPHYLKWDWLTRTFFFTNDDGSIVACDETGKYCATTVLNYAYHISSFDISPKNGIMFWSVWDLILNAPSGIIERADLDGKNSVAIIKDNTFRPSSVTVDDVMNNIYWADLKSYIVEFADFNGGQRKILLKGNPYRPLSMTIFEDDLFWLDYNNTLNRCNKFTGQDCATIHKVNANVNALVATIFHEVKQPKGENRCLNHKCHHLCLPNQSGSSCKCSDGYENKNSTCSLISTTTDSLFSTTDSDVPQTTVITDSNEVYGSTDAEEKLIASLTPEPDTNVKRIWSKHLIPMAGKLMKYGEETI